MNVDIPAFSPKSASRDIRRPLANHLYDAWQKLAELTIATDFWEAADISEKAIDSWHMVVIRQTYCNQTVQNYLDEAHALGTIFDSHNPYLR